MDKKDKIIDRVILFSSNLGLSLRSFSLSIGASPGYLHRLQSGNSNIGGDFIEKIIQQYTELNPVWLITGDGEMYKKDVEAVSEATLLYGDKDHFKEALLHYLDDKDIQHKLTETLQKGNEDPEVQAP